MSYALRHGEHVRVDVLFQYFTPRNKHLVDVITAILAMLLSITVIRLSVPYLMQSWTIGEGSANPGQCTLEPRDADMAPARDPGELV